MRLFHIKVNEVQDYSWTLNNKEYHERYAKEREQQKVLEAAQTAALAAHGVVINGKEPVIITERQMTDLTASRVKFDLINEIKTSEDDPTDLNGVMRKFNRMAARLLSLPGLQNAKQSHTAYNEKCEVHMPGQALATYNEVLLMESTCSDELQTALDKGWRMIAACPQPDARRPDYILGRFNPERIVFANGAERRP